jgi:hypothetical protein
MYISKKSEGGYVPLHPNGKFCKCLSEQIEQLLNWAGEVLLRDRKVLQYHIILHHPQLVILSRSNTSSIACAGGEVLLRDGEKSPIPHRQAQKPSTTILIVTPTASWQCKLTK